MTKYVVTRVGLSLPCRIPVLPGTPQTDAPLEDRTEYCATNAWWFVGKIPTCDYHLREFLKMAGDDYDNFLADFMGQYGDVWGQIPNEEETKPWADRHRYQDDIRRVEL